MRREVMKVLAVSAVLLMPAASAVAQAGSPCANGRVALVNAQQILASIPAYVTGDSLVAKDVATYKSELAKQQASFDSARVAYSERMTLLTPAQKTAEVKKLQDQSDNLQKHANDLDQKVNARRAELLQPIETRVQEVLDGIRAELNCAIIFDVSAAGGIASADKSLDLTGRVIERLKASSPTLPAKPGVIKPGGGDEPPTAP